LRNSLADPILPTQNAVQSPHIYLPNRYTIQLLEKLNITFFPLPFPQLFPTLNLTLIFFIRDCVTRLIFSAKAYNNK
jgi:hypothetical protein